MGLFDWVGAILDNSVGLFGWALKTMEKIAGMATAMVMYWGDSFFQNIQMMVEMWFSRARNTAVALVTIVFTLAVLLWVSILLYGTFYYAYVPAVSHTRDVNFRFDAHCFSNKGECQFPHDNITFVGEGEVQLLMRGQQYIVSLDMQMPESPPNQNLGMFMVRIDLYTHHGEVMRSAQRALMLKYKSTVLRIMETIFFLPLYLFDFRDQTQYISTELLNKYVEDPYKPIVGAFLEIQTPFVQLYKVTLRITAHFTGLRYLLFQWPLISSIIGVSVIMCFLSLVALLSWYNLFWAGVSEAGPRSLKVIIPESGQMFKHLMDDDKATTETVGMTDRVEDDAAPLNLDDRSVHSEENDSCEELESLGRRVDLNQIRQRKPLT